MAEKAVSNDFHPIPPPVFSLPGQEEKIQLTYDPTNGNTKLYKIVYFNGAVTGKTEIYTNGVWSITGIGVISDSKQRITVHDKVINSITNAKNISGTGILPGFIKNKAGSQDTGIGGVISPTAPSTLQQIGNIGKAITDIVTNPIGALTPFDVSGDAFNDVNENRLFGNPKLLIYPIDMITSQQDRLEIVQFRYKPTGAKSIFKDPTKVIQQNVQRNSALSEWIGTSVLPIPNGVSDGNNVSWGADQMNSLTAGATGKLMNDMGGYATAAGVGAAAGAVIGAGVLQGAKLAMAAKLQIDVLSAAADSAAAKGTAASAFASQILKMAGYEVSPESILARGFGIIPNSNLELLFNSPELRQFSFSYRMSPRSKEEARNVKRIIRFFKQGMAPRKQTGQAGQASFFLGTPNVFKLRYKTGKDKPISGLNKFKVCALTGFSVNYAPEGNWAAYDEGQPVTLTMAMQFSELEPIYNTDYKTDIFSTRTSDLDSVQDDDVGY